MKSTFFINLAIFKRFKKNAKKTLKRLQSLLNKDL